MSFALPLIVSFLFAFAKFAAAQNLTNVQAALFHDNVWAMNVNFLNANSSDFWHKYVLKTDCDALVQFQEVYCLGKSVNVTITNLFDSANVYNLTIKSNQTFSCSSNIQDPSEAILDPRYSKGEIKLPSGVWSIAMKLDNFTQVLGYRGYAVKATVPIDRMIVASKCRSRINPNK